MSAYLFCEQFNDFENVIGPFAVVCERRGKEHWRLLPFKPGSLSLFAGEGYEGGVLLVLVQGGFGKSRGDITRAGFEAAGPGREFIIKLIA